MEHIILIGHGSPKKDANTIDQVGRLLHDRIHQGCGGDCVRAAYLQFAEPDIMTAITDCVQAGAERIVLHPYFLYSGMHVTKDIPEVIRAAGERYPAVEFVYTEPLGTHDKLVQIVMERIEASLRKGGKGRQHPRRFQQHPIERQSFEIIADELDLGDIPAERLPVVQRVIHATADFEFRDTLRFHPDAVRAGIEAIRSGRDILTDVEMVRAGINKRLLEQWGGKVVCRISDPEVVRRAEETGKTRAAVAMELGMNGNTGIVAIGNAPTALLRAVEIAEEAPAPKPLFVGVPVGFVDALASKEVLASRDFPFITNLSRKGGTPVAVAIVNALLIMAQGSDI